MAASVLDAAATHAEHVYAGTGVENTAPLGRLGSHRVDPSSASFGAESLGVGNEGPLARGVNSHELLPNESDDREFGYFDSRSSALLNTAAATLGER